MYAAKDPEGKAGAIRYIIWSDELVCPSCNRTTTLWDACVSFKPACISSEFSCPACGHKAALDDVRRRTETVRDDVLGEDRTLRARSAVRVHGVTGKKTWFRPASRADMELLKQIECERAPAVTHPASPFRGATCTAAGNHEGISHIHHSTPPELIVFARLWERAEEYNAALRDALRFWLLSYNASHAKIMSRVVAKAGQDDLVTTSAQPACFMSADFPSRRICSPGCAASSRRSRRHSRRSTEAPAKSSCTRDQAVMCICQMGASTTSSPIRPSAETSLMPK